MKKFLMVAAVLVGLGTLGMASKAQAQCYFTQVPLYSSDGWHYGDNLYINNPYSYDVDAKPYIENYNNVGYHVYDVLVPAGGQVYCGWVANQANSDAWNYDVNMVVSEHYY
ncbi:MAG TPA: hypothetical protein VJ873_12885 [bacterium]|nr:hypothetical protein [bacterium]